MTSSRPRTPTRTRPGLLAPTVVAIVLGILGMHGVDAHGVNIHGAMEHADAATSMVSVMPGHESVAAEHGSAHSTPQPTVADNHGSRDAGGMSVMVMVCVAMLAGAAAALLGLLVRRGRLPKVWAVLRPAERPWRPAPHVLRVGTGPPSVWQFSVIRC